MVEEKGLSPDSANQIGDYVKLQGGTELIEALCGDQKLMSQVDFKAGIEDIKLMFQYCKVMGFEDKVTQNTISLSRY